MFYMGANVHSHRNCHVGFASFDFLRFWHFHPPPFFTTIKMCSHLVSDKEQPSDPPFELDEDDLTDLNPKQYEIILKSQSFPDDGSRSVKEKNKTEPIITGVAVPKLNAAAIEAHMAAVSASSSSAAAVLLLPPSLLNCPLA